MKTFLLISLMAVAATATMVRPDGATLEVSSNVYYSMTFKDFRVFYQGVSDRASYIPDETCREVKIKIFKEGDCKDAIHTYTVPGGRKAMPGIFYFSLQDATPGRYQVQVCHGDFCSYKSTSLDEIPMFREKLECYRVRWDEKTESEKRADDFSLDVLPINTFRTDLTNLTIAPKIGIKEARQIPSFENGMFYAAFDYQISYYRSLFDVETKVEDKKKRQEPYTDEYCSRKYGLMISVQLVNEKTKEIEYRFKETQYLNPEQIKKYLMVKKTAQADKQVSGGATGVETGGANGGANGGATGGSTGGATGKSAAQGASGKGKEEEGPKMIPIEVAIEDHKVKPGTYTLMIAVCPTAKDIVDFKVPCADSFKTENFEVKAPKSGIQSIASIQV